MNESISGSTTEKYQYTGKERDKECGLDYFGARYYACPVKGGDSDLGVWLSIDPMADNYPGWSPYNYCLNNPMLFFDPHGDTVVNVCEPGTDEYEYVEKTINILKQSADGLRLYNNLNKAEQVFQIKLRDLHADGTPNGSFGEFNPWAYDNGKNVLTGGDVVLDRLAILRGKEHITPATILGHEFEHAAVALNNIDQYLYNSTYWNENRANQHQDIIRQQLNIKNLLIKY